LSETKARYLKVISKLGKEGAEGIILGCTEIPLLLKQSDCDILLFDTAKIHSNAGVDHVLNL
jgi:aspartate racemase